MVGGLSVPMHTSAALAAAGTLWDVEVRLSCDDAHHVRDPIARIQSN